MPNLRLIAAADPEWNQWIESTSHDVYHTAAYHQVVTFEGDGTPQLLVYGSPGRFVAWPYLLIPIPGSIEAIGSPAFDATSVYGYSGPIVHGCEPEDPLILEAWAAFQSVWLDQQIVSVFTRFHPILRNHRWFTGVGVSDPRDDPPRGLVLTGETVSIDLRKPDAEIVAAYPRVLRQEIAANKRKGLVTELDRDWRHLETFIDLYAETMRRNQAQSAYFLRREYFTELIDALGEDAILFVTRSGPDVVAACLFLSHHGILHPHLAGTSTPFLGMSPLKVMWDEVRRWAAGRGDRVMHLGGGRGGTSDSLLSFKSRFSPDRHPFYTGRWIMEDQHYETLARRSRDEGASESGYFPIYRAPRSLE